MKTIIALAVTLVTVASIAPAAAQMSSETRERMNSMRSHPSFNSCHALAVQRGYSDTDREYDGLALMHFIHGCIMGQQR
jgi:hypothetical protein